MSQELDKLCEASSQAVPVADEFVPLPDALGARSVK
jgi:hypothetical protein